jgi:tRNA threonylcarbamoyl adenosine modification protein YeaZ
VLLLALDTSTPAVTAAVHDGDRVLAESSTVDARRHGELLAPAVTQVLADSGVRAHDLTDVVVGVGPGPFTGLRVGVVTARVMASTLGIALHGVCSLDALAAASGIVDGDFLVATDARRREVYYARYAGPYSRLTEPAVDAPATVSAAHPNLPTVGEGAVLYPDWFADPRPPVLLSAAALAGVAVHRMAEGVPLLPADPLYLRRPDAVEPGARKRVTATP